MTQREFAFDGDTYEADLDFDRLSSQLSKVRWLLTHPKGDYWTLAELASRTGGSEAGISARIRDLRKEKNGSFNIESRRWPVDGRTGLWKYRVNPLGPLEM